MHRPHPPPQSIHPGALAQTLRGIKWFHRQLLLNHGLLVGNGAVV